MSAVSFERSLPRGASLDNLRNQAKTLQKQHRAGAPEALERVAARVPSAETPLKLHDAQFVLAREYGFASWPKLVAHCDRPRTGDRVRRQGDRVFIEGVPRLRWGASAEPTYIGALEAAFRSSERPLDVTTLLGDSALAYRVRWATRDQGRAWCGSGPCGEWPEEVAALNAATGYVFAWDPPAEPSPERIERIRASIDNGWPILGFATRLDTAVFFGYEAEGQRLLVSDYWSTEEPGVIASHEAREVGMFLQRIEAPAARNDAVRAGLALALSRWRQGIVEADPTTGATYHYGSAGYERWIADLERVDTLTEAQRSNLFFLSSWTYSSLHQTRRKHAAAYLRANAQHLGTAAREPIEVAARFYEQARDRLGKWDSSSALFGYVKQKRIESWTADVRAQEVALLRDVWALEAAALARIEQALLPPT